MCEGTCVSKVQVEAKGQLTFHLLETGFSYVHQTSLSWDRLVSSYLTAGEESAGDRQALQCPTLHGLWQSWQVLYPLSHLARPQLWLLTHAFLLTDFHYNRT